MARLIDAERMPSGEFWDGLSDKEKAKVLSYLLLSPSVDAVPVVHGRWKYFHKQNIAVCTNCSFERDLATSFGKAICCPNCGATMDLEVE